MPRRRYLKVQSFGVAHEKIGYRHREDRDGDKRTRMAKKLKLQQERAVIPDRRPWTCGKDRDFGRECAARPAASTSGADPDMGHERGRQRLPLAAIHLVANWLLPRAGDFDNQLI